MAKNKLPDWQQVVLTALQSVPKAKDGQDAWNHLNLEEQAAVMDFLGEQCGPEKAADALTETCGLYQRQSMWFWVRGILGLIAILTAGCWLVFWLDRHFVNVRDYVFFILALMQTIDHLKPETSFQLPAIWRGHADTRQGTSDALIEMRQYLSRPWKDKINKPLLALCLVMLVMSIVFLFRQSMMDEILELPRQVSRVMTSAAKGEATLADAEALLADSSELTAAYAVTEVYEKAPKRSDRRYLTAALAVRMGHEHAAEYAREAIAQTRLTAIDTKVEAEAFASLLAFCDEEALLHLQERLNAVESPMKDALMADLRSALAEREHSSD